MVIAGAMRMLGAHPSGCIDRAYSHQTYRQHAHCYTCTAGHALCICLQQPLPAEGPSSSICLLPAWEKGLSARCFIDAFSRPGLEAVACLNKHMAGRHTVARLDFGTTSLAPQGAPRAQAFCPTSTLLFARLNPCQLSTLMPVS